MLNHIKKFWRFSKNHKNWIFSMINNDDKKSYRNFFSSKQTKILEKKSVLYRNLRHFYYFWWIFFLFKNRLYQDNRTLILLEKIAYKRHFKCLIRLKYKKVLITSFKFFYLFYKKDRFKTLFGKETENFDRKKKIKIPRVLDWANLQN